MANVLFFDRDISWLSFNERLLMEAENDHAPLFERIKFLSIYSSNLDEFYRVRVPALMALEKLNNHKKVDGIAEKNFTEILHTIDLMVQKQITDYGRILSEKLIPALLQNGYLLGYDNTIRENIQPFTTAYFFNEVLCYIQPQYLKNVSKKIFPANNKLYLFAILLDALGNEEEIIIDIPSDKLPRFFSVTTKGINYIVFLDDIIRDNLDKIFTGRQLKGCYSFKITRDAELNLQDEYEGDLAEKMEEQISKRDYGFATRFLHSPNLPLRYELLLADKFNISSASFVSGGEYHNLKDLSSLPIYDKALSYSSLTPLHIAHVNERSLLQQIAEADIILHAPYQDYTIIQRFFNEAAIEEDVIEIYVTLYRVANNSKIVEALINAAKNGKKVSAFVELKARFDEGNNIKWARKMKDAGVKIIYSHPSLKVHAKVALVKRKRLGRTYYTGLFSTGNLNESTARFYTDHVLLTAHKGMLQEAELLFIYLSQRRKLADVPPLHFKHLFIAQFNLQQRFLALIDREIDNTKQGLPATIVIKVNNLEDRTLIDKLYEASNAGVKINLIVRSICCIVPGIEGMSANITVRRIVDRFLEHGRAFIFHNNGNEEIFLGSADWMNRNIYRRIEVCFPVYDERIKKQVRDIVYLQLADNTNAVYINGELQNIYVGRQPNEAAVNAQQSIYNYLKSIPQS